MFRINGVEAKILETEFKFSRFVSNHQTIGYQGFVLVSFSLNGEKGYFDFYLDLVEDSKISNYENRSYCCVPIDNEKEISYLELFDTKHFYDVVDFSNTMTVHFAREKNNKIKTFVEIQELFVSLKFQGDLEIKE